MLGRTPTLSVGYENRCINKRQTCSHILRRSGVENIPKGLVQARSLPKTSIFPVSGFRFEKGLRSD